MGSSVHQLATTAMPRASFVVHQPYLFPVDGKKVESFLVILEENGVNGRRRGRRGRVIRIDDVSITAAKAVTEGDPAISQPVNPTGIGGVDVSGGAI